MDYQAKAQAFRRNHPNIPAAAGVVVFNRENVAAGWMNELRDPQHWEPGCRAVDALGSIWLAIGGNDYDGAKAWTLEYDPLSHMPRGMREVAREEQQRELARSQMQRGARL